MNTERIFATVLVVGISLGILMQALAKTIADTKGPTKSLQLGQIYSSTNQEGPKRVIDLLTGNEREQFFELLDKVHGMGLSNVFLARADTIGAAVKATLGAFAGGQPVSVPVAAEGQNKSEYLWLVAYLGVEGSDPPAWVLSSVEINDKIVQLKFKMQDASTQNRHQYHVWAPLGKVGPGTYTLQLFNEDHSQVLFSRRVTISEK